MYGEQPNKNTEYKEESSKLNSVQLIKSYDIEKTIDFAYDNTNKDKNRTIAPGELDINSDEYKEVYDREKK